MSIQDNLEELRQSISLDKVTIIAVSKTHPYQKIQLLYDTGQRDFGENKVQEMLPKYEQLPKDIRWHMIGHLQSNKVKYIASFVHLIHSIDSLKLLKEVNKQGIKYNRIIDCLLQVHIAAEETKFGFDENEIKALLKSEEFRNLKNIRIRGLMGMATNTENDQQVRKEFSALAALFNILKSTAFKSSSNFDILSMGMTQDYKLAIAEGSTMIRVGSQIFGERNYLGK